MANLRAPVFFAALAAGALLAAPAGAQEDDLEKSYFAAKLMLGVGGEVEMEAQGLSAEDDLSVSYGVGLQYMARLHSYFALGALLSLQSWQAEAADDTDRDRSVNVDGALVPAAVWPVNREIELYFALGLGLSMDFLEDESLAINVPLIGTAVAVELDEAIGFALLPVLGARFALSSDVGLLAELGYSVHSYEHDVLIWTDVLTDATVRIPFDLSLGQVALNLGVFF